MLSKLDLERFDSDGVGVGNGNYFGFPFSRESCDLVLMSVPWDATVSYGAGTSEAPEAIIEASLQVEILDSHFEGAWTRGIATLPEVAFAKKFNEQARELAQRIIEDAESGETILSDDERNNILSEVNSASKLLNRAVYEQAKAELDSGKIVGLVGGDHSTPLGLIEALSERGEFGVLHIDAHCDLRDAYEGFEFSHASIMRNALKNKGVKKLVQVAVRDFSKEELEFAKSDKRVVQYTDFSLSQRAFEGEFWEDMCNEIVMQLPKNVYVSFDIDGLQQQFCPSTGTPVPGGLSYSQAVHLLYLLSRSGKKIIGFDLTEVASGLMGEWDANVGARILYKLCNMTLSSKG